MQIGVNHEITLTGFATVLPLGSFGGWGRRGVRGGRRVARVWDTICHSVCAIRNYLSVCREGILYKMPLVM